VVGVLQGVSRLLVGLPKFLHSNQACFLAGILCCRSVLYLRGGCSDISWQG
jgi:hypothetical protein